MSVQHSVTHLVHVYAGSDGQAVAAAGAAAETSARWADGWTVDDACFPGPALHIASHPEQAAARLTEARRNADIAWWRHTHALTGAPLPDADAADGVAPADLSTEWQSLLAEPTPDGGALRGLAAAWHAKCVADLALGLWCPDSYMYDDVLLDANPRPLLDDLAAHTISGQSWLVALHLHH